jgi:hypothetical protein
MVLAKRNRFGIRGRLLNLTSRFSGREGQRGLEFAVLRKGFGARPVNKTAITIELIRTLPRTLQRPNNIVGVGQNQRCEIDQDGTVRVFGNDIETC